MAVTPLICSTTHERHPRSVQRPEGPPPLAISRLFLLKTFLLTLFLYLVCTLPPPRSECSQMRHEVHGVSQATSVSLSCTSCLRFQVISPPCHKCPMAPLAAVPTFCRRVVLTGAKYAQISDSTGLRRASHPRLPARLNLLSRSNGFRYLFSSPYFPFLLAVYRIVAWTLLALPHR